MNMVCVRADISCSVKSPSSSSKRFALNCGDYLQWSAVGSVSDAISLNAPRRLRLKLLARVEIEWITVEECIIICGSHPRGRIRLRSTFQAVTDDNVSYVRNVC